MVETKKKSQLSKNQLKRLKKKNKPTEESTPVQEIEPESQPQPSLPENADPEPVEINIDDVPDEFKQIFQKFQPVDEEQTVSDACDGMQHPTDSIAGGGSKE